MKILSKKELTENYFGKQTGYQKLQREIKIMKLVNNHSGVIKLVEILDDKSHEKVFFYYNSFNHIMHTLLIISLTYIYCIQQLYLIMELAEGGSVMKSANPKNQHHKKLSSR